MKNKNWLIITFLFLLGCIRITQENIKNGIKRYRIKIGLPFKYKRTFILIDKNMFSPDVVIHVFDYDKELAYQFLNFKYNYTLGLYDVE